MDLKVISENIRKCADLQSKMNAFGVPLEQFDPRHLQITDENFEEHVRIQPTAICFYGVCLKQAAQEISRIKFEYDLWRQKKYIATKSSLGKATKDEIEAHLEADNEGELKDWFKQLHDAESQHGDIEAIYKAWTQKGFTLREHAKLRGDEWNTSGSIMAPGNKTSMGNGAIPAPYNLNAGAAKFRKFVAEKEKEKESNKAADNIGS